MTDSKTVEGQAVEQLRAALSAVLDHAGDDQAVRLKLVVTLIPRPRDGDRDKHHAPPPDPNKEIE
jgi:hypothetical protein